MHANWRIVIDPITDPQVIDILVYHRATLFENSPANTVFALGLTGLRAPRLTLWTAWEGPTLLGCGALQDRDDGAGEVKAMRTHPQHRRRGLARPRLGVIVVGATARGQSRRLLETGSAPLFDAAMALDREAGFCPFSCFCPYSGNGFSRFFELALAGVRSGIA